MNLRLKELREEKRMTQSELAEALHTKQQNIGRWENGKADPSTDWLDTLAEYFDVSVDYLMYRTKTRKYEVDQKTDLKKLIQDNAMTYGGKEISEHDLKVLEGVVNSILGGGANGDK